MRNIGVKIKKIRTSKKITQKGLSELTSIEQTIISRYENGKIIPPIPKLELIAQALGISLSDLLSDAS